MPKLSNEDLIPENFILNLLSIAGPLSPAQVHRAYRGKLAEVNQTRPRKEKLRGPRYHSMLRYFHRLEAEGKIERAGTIRTMQSGTEKLIRIQKDGTVGRAVQILYRKK